MYQSGISRFIQKAYHFHKSNIGERFFVVFDPNEPENCSLLPYNPVPDSINTYPLEGWDKLPIGELNNLIQ